MTYKSQNLRIFHLGFSLYIFFLFSHTHFQFRHLKKSLEGQIYPIQTCSKNPRRYNDHEVTQVQCISQAITFDYTILDKFDSLLRKNPIANIGILYARAQRISPKYYIANVDAERDHEEFVPKTHPIIIYLFLTNNLEKGKPLSE